MCGGHPSLPWEIRINARARTQPNQPILSRSTTTGIQIMISFGHYYLLRLLLVVRLLKADGRSIFAGFLQKRRLLVGR